MQTRLLLIDDDMDQRLLIASFLENNGYEIDTAETIQEATALIQETDYRGFLIDVMMPGGGGLKMLSEIRALSKEPVIVLTAARDDLKEEFLREGANGFCSKQYISTALMPLLSDFVPLIAPR